MLTPFKTTHVICVIINYTFNAYLDRISVTSEDNDHLSVHYQARSCMCYFNTKCIVGFGKLESFLCNK